nr:PREDICTED: uncharacterized protein LOC106707033 [Latimeria chalumnae]|eukprot:XP_014354265.1 PREDICTED: uncharacterized protein LOC106707033 [Latimeria chalumnae]
MLAWEHERFVLRRVPAFTLSHLDHHNSSRRSSIMDTSSQLDIKRLHRNTVIIAESITRFLYGLSEKGFPRELQVFKGRLEVEESRLAALIGWLASQPRAAQLLEKDHSVVSTMEYLFNRHLKDVRCHIFKADKREPEFVFYDQLKQTMIAYRPDAGTNPYSLSDTQDSNTKFKHYKVIPAFNAQAMQLSARPASRSAAAQERSATCLPRAPKETVWTRELLNGEKMKNADEDLTQIEKEAKLQPPCVGQPLGRRTQAASACRVPSSGRTYRLEGVDPRVDGSPANEKRLKKLLAKIERSIPYSEVNMVRISYPEYQRRFRPKTSLDYR